MRPHVLLSTAIAACLALTSVVSAAPAPPVAAVATASPREEVAGIAQAIEDHYFDPVKGKAIADELRAAAARGEFDALTDPRDLAQVLTRRLQPIDHHFAIGWPVDPPPGGGGPGPGGPGPGPGPGPGGPPPVREEDPADARDNYGFHKVDVLPGNLGYIELRQFADFDFGDPNAGARAAADAALQLVSRTDAVIIDLRDNGGGSPAMVGYLASAFADPKADIYNVFHFREGTESEAPKTPYAHPRLATPVYILTSARTGSAAEALAYTLQAAHRAIIVGEASGGAANPGGRVPAGNRFAVFVSMGSPVNAITHANWEGAGVQPDVAVPAGQALDRARILALEGLTKTLTGDARTDSQWALEGLKAELAAPLPFKGGDYEGGYSGATIAMTPGGLTYQRGRRPAWPLVALGPDLFTVRGEPGRRLAFERDASGKVVAVELRGSDGASQRLRRGD